MEIYPRPVIICFAWEKLHVLIVLAFTFYDDEWIWGFLCCFTFYLS